MGRAEVVADAAAAAVAVASIQVQVAVGVAPNDVHLVSLSLPVGSTVRDALRASGVLGNVAELSEAALAAGDWALAVWGRKERPSHVLRDRDRVEILRGLKVDPKEARRLRFRDQGGRRQAKPSKPARS